MPALMLLEDLMVPETPKTKAINKERSGDSGFLPSLNSHEA